MRENQLDKLPFPSSIFFLFSPCFLPWLLQFQLLIATITFLRAPPSTTNRSNNHHHHQIYLGRPPIHLFINFRSFLALFFKVKYPTLVIPSCNNVLILNIIHTFFIKVKLVVSKLILIKYKY